MAKTTPPKRCANCDCEVHDLDVHFPLCLIATTTKRIAERIGDLDDHVLGLAGMLDNKLSRIADGIGNMDSTATRIADVLEEIHGDVTLPVTRIADALEGEKKEDGS